jgi:two-component system, NarL family, response regulator DevR
VLKQTCGRDLVDAVRTVAAGQSTLDTRAAQAALERVSGRIVTVDALSSLTDQERRVLDLIGLGMTNRQIAARMSLSEKTVKNYVASLLSKLGMHRRSQAAAHAVGRHLAGAWPAREGQGGRLASAGGRRCRSLP